MRSIRFGEIWHTNLDLNLLNQIESLRNENRSPFGKLLEETEFLLLKFGKS